MSLNAKAEPIKVAVIDTGFNPETVWDGLEQRKLVKPTLCPTGHKYFTGTSLNDNHGHGTHIAGLIAKYSDNAEYCLIIMKYYDPVAVPRSNLMNTIESFIAAIDQKVDIINYSGGGLERSEVECQVVKVALDKGIKVIAAAGNERSDLTKRPYYPAMCDDRIVVVENVDPEHSRVPSSNYGPNTIKEQGLNLISIMPNGTYGPMTGTSQATAVVTGKTVKLLYEVKKFYKKYNDKYLNILNRNVA